MTEEAPVKTAVSILTDIAAVLEIANKVTENPELRAALDAVPPSDMNTLMQHIQSMYAACEGMKINYISFRCDTDTKRVIAIIGIQFGVREIELFAPFDAPGAANMLNDLVGSMKLLAQSSPIIMPDSLGNA